MVNETIESLLGKIRSSYINIELIRIGGPGDGGYLMPNLANEISCCFSPGVSNVADFEKQLIEKYDIDCYLADGSVNQPPITSKKVHFLKKFIKNPKDKDSITLKKWVQSTSACNSKDLLLQMDIEGSEYAVILGEEDDFLKKFKCMIIEFHFLEKIEKIEYARLIYVIFEKLLKHFYIVHIHPNNCCGIANVLGYQIPRVVEVTFLRHDILKKTDVIREKKTFPHKLDSPNLLDRPELILPPEWHK